CVPVIPGYSQNILAGPQWLMPVIPATLEGQAVGGSTLSPGVSRPAWPTWQNPISTKIQK
uniref:Uncharacterized protein n=1 Tax=Astyanax mexicanus TaxID=7994 RepID=A0A3B1ISP6_ASTMX